MEPYDSWDYRIIRIDIFNEDSETQVYHLAEVYYDEEGEPASYNIELSIQDTSHDAVLDEVRKIYEALSLPVLDATDLAGE